MLIKETNNITKQRWYNSSRKFLVEFILRQHQWSFTLKYEHLCALSLIVEGPIFTFFCIVCEIQQSGTEANFGDARILKALVPTVSLSSTCLQFVGLVLRFNCYFDSSLKVKGRHLTPLYSKSSKATVQHLNSFHLESNPIYIQATIKGLSFPSSSVG